MEPNTEKIEETPVEETKVEKTIVEETAVAEPTEKVVEETVIEETVETPVKEEKKASGAPKILSIIALVVSFLFAVISCLAIHGLVSPTYTYYDSDGAAVATVQFDGSGEDLISAWNVCAADTMAISDDQKTALSDKGYELIFNDYVVKVSDKEAWIVTGAGSDNQKVYAKITTVTTTDSDGNTTETDIETCVENLAVAITGGAYTRENNSWILNIFK